MPWYSQYKGISITRFLEGLEQNNLFWAVKRLSGNDTGLTGGHQSGIYLPRWFFEKVFPEICRKDKHNPHTALSGCYFPQYDLLIRKISAIYYNAKFFSELGLKKKYDEFRLTGWGGKKCPIQDPENTGALVIIACGRIEGNIKGLAWACSSVEEEALAESWLGVEVSPSEVYGPIGFQTGITTNSIRILAKKSVEDKWLKTFPSGEEIFKKVVKIIPQKTWNRSIDKLLLKRRSLEFAIFKDIEQAHVLPLIRNGFNDLDNFLSLALSVANRRKSRTGYSLELNLAEIFTASNLLFEMYAVTELKKKPDFLFPSQKDYQTPSFPSTKLHMLAAKTCCKERWRQVLSEADRITPKHLFTLQEGVSENQLKEMYESNLKLVVPRPNKKSFPHNYRQKIMDLEAFIKFICDSQHKISS